MSNEKTHIEYEWDEDKDESNQRKHGIAFADAISVFDDPSLLSDYDPDHSGVEDRWVTLGRVETGLVLVVVHTARGENGEERIRIISARKATNREEMQYYNQTG